MRAHAVRLMPGADLRVELKRLVETLGLRASCIVACVGSLSHARLRMPGAAGVAEVVRDYEEPMEIVSLSGTLSPDGVHIHISLSRADGGCIGGHLIAGCVINTTAELVLGELTDVEFRRLPDPATGYAELAVLQASGDNASADGR